MQDLMNIMSIGAGSPRSASDFGGNMNTWDVARVTGGSSPYSSTTSSPLLLIPPTTSSSLSPPSSSSGSDKREKQQSVNRYPQNQTVVTKKTSDNPDPDFREKVFNNSIEESREETGRQIGVEVVRACDSSCYNCRVVNEGGACRNAEEKSVVNSTIYLDKNGTDINDTFITTTETIAREFITGNGSSESDMTTSDVGLLFGIDGMMGEFDSAFNASFNDSGSSWNASLYNDTYIILGEGLYPSGYSLPHIILASIVVTLLMIVIVVGNMLVIIAIATEKALKNIQNWFIASLAVADFFLGLVIMPFSLANEIMGYWIFGYWWCDIYSAMDVLLCTASIMNLCLISLDRFWSITQAVDYLKKRTPARAALMIAMVWLMSALVCIPPLLGWKRPTPEEEYPKCRVSTFLSWQ